MSDELLLELQPPPTLFLAGHETTANALTRTWYLLAQHPEVESRLRQEVGFVLGSGFPRSMICLDWTRRAVAFGAIPAPLPSGVDHRTGGRNRLSTGSLRRASRSYHLYEPLCHPARSPFLGKSGAIRSRAVVGRRCLQPAEIRLLPIRRRNTRLYPRTLLRRWRASF